MPLYEEDESVAVSEQVNPVKVKAYPEAYRGIAIDTKYMPQSSMLAWINGSNWRVTYFSQILAPTQEPTPLALDREPPYQQYQRIMGIDIKVNQPLDISQDERIRTFSVTGSGHTYPALTPNQGDMMFGNIGDGRIGIFTITSARRETFMRDSTYAIEWKMVGFLTQQQIDDLERKTQITYYWSSDKLANGCNPFVTEAEQAMAQEFAKVRAEIIRRYIADFFSTQFYTFLVPDQLNHTYDHFVTKLLLSILDTSRDWTLRRARILNVQSERVMSEPTVWDMLVRQNPAIGCGATERAHLVMTMISRWKPELQAIGYSGIPRMVYPIDAPTDVDSAYDGSNRCRPEGIPYQAGKPRRPPKGPYQTQAQRNEKWFQRVPPEQQLDLNKAWSFPPDIKPVVIDDYYVFSEAFYYEDAKLQSKLELLVWQMIRGEDINKEQLLAVVKCCLSWDNLERFYYHPALILLLGYTLRK
jgi:hypothetical protein